MATPSQPKEFSSLVSREDYDEFMGNFPLHGSVAWFIRTSLKEFNKKCREDPTAIERIKEAITEMMREPFSV